MGITVGIPNLGLPYIVASINLSGLGADQVLGKIVAPFEGIYDPSGAVVVSRAATTSSSTPTMRITYTDAITGTVIAAQAFVSANAGNTVGAAGGLVGADIFNIQAGSTITIDLNGTSSVGGTTLQFYVAFKLAYLGTGQ